MSEDLAHIFQKFMQFVKDYPQLSNEDVVAFASFLGLAVGEAYAAGLKEGATDTSTESVPNENN